jgi:hypothetical protein
MITKGEYNYFKRIEQKFPCGCHIDEMIDNSYGITYCPLHQAAPELLETLKQTYSWCWKHTNSANDIFDELGLNLIRAIAKAEGR